MITLIAAVARNGVIGNQNTIPWHIPEDFKHFSKTTKNHVVIMGMKTWDSLPQKFKPLPERENIVVSRQPQSDEWASTYRGKACHCPTIDHALKAAESLQRNLDYLVDDEIFIIGGASLYEQTMGIANKLVISEIDMEPDGDTCFPEIGPEWKVSSRDTREGFSIITYIRA